jgi:hypothetical protein
MQQVTMMGREFFISDSQPFLYKSAVRELLQVPGIFLASMQSLNIAAINLIIGSRPNFK